MVNPELALAYDMKESFFRVYGQEGKMAARTYFDDWWKWVSREGCKELKSRAVKLNDKLDYILNWYDFKITNGFAEGLNSKVQKIKTDGCGFPRVDNFIRFCYLRLGNVLIDFIED